VGEIEARRPAEKTGKKWRSRGAMGAHSSRADPPAVNRWSSTPQRPGNQDASHAMPTAPPSDPIPDPPVAQEWSFGLNRAAVSPFFFELSLPTSPGASGFPYDALVHVSRRSREEMSPTGSGIGASSAWPWTHTGMSCCLGVVSFGR
jgi:hypothetical protein